MISVVIATRNDERTLGQTLSALVPAAIDGLVREVILADGGSTDDTLEIAEDAGARVVRCDGPQEARIAQGCRAARADWIMIVAADAIAPEGWERAAADHLNGGSGRAASWGRRGVWPFAGPASAVLVPRGLYEREMGSAGWSRRLAAKARALKIRG